ncbi:MAG: type IX secretion system protein PorQ [Ignavibacteriales bacterium]|nr:type IX secretion system protein PorQ [Ignavibacteriales bacterium]
MNRSNFKQIFHILILLVFTSVAAFGQGNTVYEFLRNEPSARVAALGGSFLMATDDPNTIFYNPAGITTLSSTKLSVGFMKHLLDINAGILSYGMELKDIGMIGAGVKYINYGDFKRTGEEGQDLGTFSAGEFAFVLGYGDKLLDNLSYGANAKFVYSSIAEVNSSGAALDFGLSYSAIPGRLHVGASVMNLGTQLDPYMNTREKLPVDVAIGAAVYPEHLPAIVFIDFHKLTESEKKFINHFKQFSVGVEFLASPNFQLRVGYNNERRQELELGQTAGMAGFSIGGGFFNDMYNIDYGFTSLGMIGAIHRINIGFRFE